MDKSKINKEKFFDPWNMELPTETGFIRQCFLDNYSSRHRGMRHGRKKAHELDCGKISGLERIRAVAATLGWTVSAAKVRVRQFQKLHQEINMNNEQIGYLHGY
jgi:hypothetical protein